VHYDLGEYELAISDYSLGLRINKSAAWALWSRGVSFAQLSQSDLAQSDIDAAIALLSPAERERMVLTTCSELIGQGSIALSLRYCAKTVSQ
jgi:tetratricopeptide (TPR) repeat protein